MKRFVKNSIYMNILILFVDETVNNKWSKFHILKKQHMRKDTLSPLQIVRTLMCVHTASENSQCPP